MNLSPRRAEALALLCRGLTNTEIAAAQGVGEETVKTRVRQLLALFGARNRAHLAALALASGTVHPRELRGPR